MKKSSWRLSIPKNEGVAFVEQEELITIRRQLHQIPEIGLEERGNTSLFT